MLCRFCYHCVCTILVVVCLCVCPLCSFSRKYFQCFIVVCRLISSFISSSGICTFPFSLTWTVIWESWFSVSGFSGFHCTGDITVTAKIFHKQIYFETIYLLDQELPTLPEHLDSQCCLCCTIIFILCSALLTFVCIFVLFCLHIAL